MSSMNYGLLNLRAQNGKPGIFWSNERTKKNDRKFGYKTKDQRYGIRQYPSDLHADPDNLLQPIEPPPEEKPKKPAKNFIKRNRENMGKKNKNKENDQTVTLTQEQLNAILASVGKVASGKEDGLRISIDNNKHEIHIDSPGRDGDGDHKPRRHRNKKKDEEPSLFSLIDDGNKKSSRHSEDKRRHDRTPDRSDSSDRYRSRKHSGDRDHHRKHSGERDHRRRHSSDRDHSNERHRDHSHDRHRKHSGDRYRGDSRERSRRHSRSRERYRTPSRERRRRSPSDDRSYERRRHSREDRSRERRRYSPDDRSHERRRHSRTPSADRYRKHTPERKEEPKVEDNPPSPREIAGIPLSLPWKHMTKAERRRLMIAREKVLAEENRSPLYTLVAHVPEATNFEKQR